LVALLAAHARPSLQVDLICALLVVSPSALRATVVRIRRPLASSPGLVREGDGGRADLDWVTNHLGRW
jgi:hypothetical protein